MRLVEKICFKAKLDIYISSTSSNFTKMTPQDITSSSAIQSSSTILTSRFDRILSSELFTFLVGPDREPVHDHSALFDKISLPLHSLMNNKMKEGIEKRCKLENVGHGLFITLCEFAFTGDYRLPTIQSRSSEEHSDFTSKHEK